MAPSCPVDRRPFSHVYRWDRILGCVQVNALFSLFTAVVLSFVEISCAVKLRHPLPAVNEKYGALFSHDVSLFEVYLRRILTAEKKIWLKWF